MRTARTPACGSCDPTHIARRCFECNRIYKGRTRKGWPSVRQDPARCAFCGLAAGNSLGVKVLRYPLLRRVNRPNGRQTSVCIGSMGLCDRCVRTNAYLNERASAA